MLISGHLFVSTNMEIWEWFKSYNVLCLVNGIIFFSKPDTLQQFIFLPHICQTFLKRSEDLSVTPMISKKESTMEQKLAPLKATMSALFCGEKRLRKTRHCML